MKIKCEFCGYKFNKEDEICPHCGKYNSTSYHEIDNIGRPFDNNQEKNHQNHYNPTPNVNPDHTYELPKEFSEKNTADYEKDFKENMNEGGNFDHIFSMPEEFFIQNIEPVVNPDEKIREKINSIAVGVKAFIVITIVLFLLPFLLLTLGAFEFVEDAFGLIFIIFIVNSFLISACISITKFKDNLLRLFNHGDYAEMMRLLEKYEESRFLAYIEIEILLTHYKLHDNQKTKQLIGLLPDNMAMQSSILFTVLSEIKKMDELNK